MKVTLDTNIIVYLQNRYPRDIFKSLWDLIEFEASHGDACICEAIFQELERGGDDLADWAKSIPNFVCSTSSNELGTVKKIGDDYPGWVREQKNAGDPFIIAHAKAEDRLIVTDEKRKGAGAVADKNQKIPNIADEHGVSCQSFFEYMRSRNWTF